MAALGAIRNVVTSDSSYQVVGSPVRFDHEHVEALTPSPRLGADTYDVLRELAFSNDEIDLLVSDGVVQCR